MSVTHGTRRATAWRDETTLRYRALAEMAGVGTGPVADVHRRAAEAALRALGGASASLSVFEPAASLVRCLVNVGELGPGELAHPVDEVYPLLEFGNLGLLVDGEQGVLVHVDQEDQSDDYIPLLRQFGKTCCLSVPVPLEGRVWGELFVTRGASDVPFTPQDLDFATAVAAMVGAALATAEHVRRVEELAHSDELTGLANRRAIEQRLEEAFGRYQREGVAIGVVLCDLNGLKRLNDDHGHPAGDRALVRFSALLSAAAGRMPGALAGRLGGDEFCIVASGVPGDDVVAAADELCRLVRRSPLEGVSVGVVSTDHEFGDVDRPNDFLRLADTAQYSAKRSRSPVPVVVGRTLPADVSGASVLHPHIGHDRRLLRGRPAADILRLLDDGLRALRDVAGAPTEVRLAAVAQEACLAVGGSAWWLSLAEPGGTHLRTVRFGLIRVPTTVDPQLAPWGGVGEEFALADYPTSGTLLAGGAAVIEAGSPELEPAEAALLAEMGATAVCMAGATSTDGRRWLAELYADEVSHGVADAAVPLRALIALAASGTTAG